MSTIGIVLRIFGTLLLALAIGSPIDAQEKYPSRPVELIVPWGPGGGADQIGRVVAKLLDEQLKVSVTVLNVPGATGNIGMGKLVNAPADGYTVAVLTADTYTTLATSTPTWTLKDITPLAVMIKQPSGLFVSGSSALKTWADIAKNSKSKPLTVAISGVGSPDEITVNYFNARGLQLIAVPYAKPGERYSAILGGHVDLLYSPVGNIKGYVDGGLMRPVLFLNSGRVEGYGDTPTSKELGYDILMPQFRAFVVRSGTDPARLKVLQEAFARVYEHPEYRKFLVDATGSPDSFETGTRAFSFMQSELEAMKGIIAKGGK
jgi:tripartite-type tricarboxylate transporter receptor subunit TctC